MGEVYQGAGVDNPGFRPVLLKSACLHLAVSATGEVSTPRRWSECEKVVILAHLISPQKSECKQHVEAERSKTLSARACLLAYISASKFKARSISAYANLHLVQPIAIW